MNISNILLSIVVCTYNGSDILSYCIDSLISQTISPDSFEIIIIDNNSTDGTYQVACSYMNKHPNFRYFKERIQGLSNARNRGIKESTGRYIAYLDDDACADKEWAARILTAFKEVKPSPSAVGGQIRPWYWNNPPAWFDDSLELRSWGDNPRFLDTVDDKYGFSGSNMAFNKKILEKYGGFSTEFGMSGEHMRMGEESELFARMCLSHEIFYYDPSIFVKHRVVFKNFEYRYLFLRSFKSGVSHYHIDQACFKMKPGLKYVFKGLASILHLPVYVLFSGNIRLALAKKLKSLGHYCGYCFGQLCHLFKFGQAN